MLCAAGVAVLLFPGPRFGFRGGKQGKRSMQEEGQPWQFDRWLLAVGCRGDSGAEDWSQANVAVKRIWRRCHQHEELTSIGGPAEEESPHTIDESVNDEPPVLFHQIIHVTKNATVEKSTELALLLVTLASPAPRKPVALSKTQGEAPSVRCLFVPALRLAWTVPPSPIQADRQTDNSSGGDVCCVLYVSGDRWP